MPPHISLGAFLGTKVRSATTEHHSHVGDERAPRDRAGPSQTSKVAMRYSSVDRLNPLVSWGSRKLYSLQGVQFQPHM